MLLLDPHARPIIAHRGDRAHAPENTMRAFAQAIATGADAIELDVHLSADGQVVVCHDDTVDRTTNGTGTVSSMPYATLRTLNAGGGERIPLLTDVLDAFADVPLVIDFKANAATEPALTLLDKAGARGRVVLGSFDAAPIALARRRGFATTASPGELQRMLLRAALRRGPAPQTFDAIALPPTYYSMPLPIGGYVRASGVPVYVWTINDPAHAVRLWNAGVRGIITDDPAAMVAARASLLVA
jgi:glycerophosphoryl diester phosphodiesterase